MKKVLKEIYIYILIIVLVLLFRKFVATPVKVNGDSMINTLKDKDIMILDKISYRFKKIKRFDIVVIKEKDEYLIKRIIGLPGETIEYKNNKLYIDNKYIKENFSHKKTSDFFIKTEDDNTIPKDSYFVLGDNRENSTDSRIIGFIKKENILGKTSLTIFPFNRFGIKK